jgi:hypothetical protein
MLYGLVSLSTRRHIPESLSLQQRHCGYLKSLSTGAVNSFDVEVRIFPVVDHRLEDDIKWIFKNI